MGQSQHRSGSGPFRADQLHDGDRYELSNGHPIYCAPAGPDHASRSLTGAAVIASDPDVEWVGVDAGFSPEPGTLRAPDVAVAAPPSGRGWIPGVPLLAVEYASVGQDEADLQTKIGELLRGGSRAVWVVRLLGPRRVEVHRPGEPMRVATVGESLGAPGILRNPVPVEALFEHAAADRATLRNLLQRAGYTDLEAVREEGRETGREEGRRGLADAIIALLAVRGMDLTPAVSERIHACRDLDQLKAWLLAAARVTEPTRIFD
jgi:Uma2 family endonuclease